MTKASHYKRTLRFLGGLSLALSAYLLLLHSPRFSVLLFAALAAGAGWLHFRLPPAGQIRLSPMIVFVSLLLENPYVAPAIAAVAAISYSIAFSRLRFREALEIVSEETIPTLAALAVFVSLEPEKGGKFGLFMIAVLAYIVVRTLLVGTTAYFVENVGFRRFLTGPARKLVGNMLFFALAGYGIEVYLYIQFGFLALALATIALAEIYHPWKLLSEQEDVLFASLAMVAQAIDIKDPYTARHSRNVAELAIRLARGMGLPEQEVRKIRIGSLMHDIGKVGVSGSIIRKPMKLNPNEDSLMRQHPVLSADIMQPIELLEDAAEIVRHHHEHFDGSGYPEGKQAEEIPLGSRVILVADAFDAMTTDRPYRRGRSASEALRVLKEHAGRQFDPRVVRSLEAILDIS